MPENVREFIYDLCRTKQLLDDEWVWPTEAEIDEQVPLWTEILQMTPEQVVALDQGAEVDPSVEFAFMQTMRRIRQR